LIPRDLLTETHLQNGLEVEGQAVPEGKFARTGPSDQTSALRRPGQRENWTAHLVSGRLHKPRGNCIRGIVQVSRRRQHMWHVNAVWLQGQAVPMITLEQAVLRRSNKYIFTLLN